MDSISIVWKDETKYHPLDKERVPRVIVAALGKVDLIIHISMNYKWLFTSRYLSIDHMELSSTTLEECKVEALEIAKASIQRKLVELGESIEIIQ